MPLHYPVTAQPRASFPSCLNVLNDLRLVLHYSRLRTRLVLDAAVTNVADTGTARGRTVCDELDEGRLPSSEPAAVAAKRDEDLEDDEAEDLARKLCVLPFLLRRKVRTRGRARGQATREDITRVEAKSLGTRSRG